FFLFSLPAFSILFPYTTLFRSSRYIRTMKVPEVPWVPEVRVVLGVLTVLAGLVAPLGAQAPRAPRHWAKGSAIRLWIDPEQMPPDRKSTRLNSSHQIISYAVFC